MISTAYGENSIVAHRTARRARLAIEIRSLLTQIRIGGTSCRDVTEGQVAGGSDTRLRGQSVSGEALACVPFTFEWGRDDGSTLRAPTSTVDGPVAAPMVSHILGSTPGSRPSSSAIMTNTDTLSTVRWRYYELRMSKLLLRRPWALIPTEVAETGSACREPAVELLSSRTMPQ